MSETTAIWVLVGLTLFILSLVTWLTLKSLQRSIDQMEEVIGDGSLLGRTSDE